jgi:hypothetical protein
MSDSFSLEKLTDKLARAHITDRDRRKAEEAYIEACSSANELLGPFARQCKHYRLLHVLSEASFCNSGPMIRTGSVLVTGAQRICLDCGLVEKCRLPDNAVELDRHELAERFGRDFDTENVRATLQQEAEARTVFHELSGEPTRTINTEEFIKLFGEHPADRFRKLVEPEELYTLWMNFGRPKLPEDGSGRA